MTNSTKRGRPFDAHPDRIGETEVEFPGGIVLAILSVYLHCGEGFSQRNLDILVALLAAVLSLNMPWCIGGDFNLESATFGLRLCLTGSVGPG